MNLFAGVCESVRMFISLLGISTDRITWLMHTFTKLRACHSVGRISVAS